MSDFEEVYRQMNERLAKRHSERDCQRLKDRCCIRCGGSLRSHSNIVPCQDARPSELKLWKESPEQYFLAFLPPESRTPLEVLKHQLELVPSSWTY